MQKLRYFRVRTIVALGAVFFSSGRLAYSAQPPLDSGAEAPAPIVVIRGPNGLTVSSQDLAALDEFERLLAKPGGGLSSAPLAVFYLKHAEAPAVKEELEKILAGGGSSDADGSSEQGAKTSQRKSLATGAIKITAETRLNALLVLANRADQSTVKQMLAILDQKESPEVNAVSPRPRMIRVLHAQAKDIADVLRQVYADRLVVGQGQFPQIPGGNMPFFLDGGGPGGGGPGAGGPGGGSSGAAGGQAGRGGGGGQNNRVDPANRIAISIDARTNHLIVAATDPVFEEVKQLVRQLDAAKAGQHETTRMVPLHRSSAVIVERTLAAIVGDGVQIRNPHSPSTAANPRSNTTPAGPPSAAGRFGRVPGEQRSMDGDDRDWWRFMPPGGPGQ